MVSRNRKTGLESVEPSKMSLPAMDRVSVTFALALDSFVIDTDDEGFHTYLVCSHCTEVVCEVETTDTMRVLLNTALAHTCGE